MEPRIYVAGPWAHKDACKHTVLQLRAAGLHVTSRWVFRPETEYECDPKLMESEALRDIEDIDDANVFFHLNLEKSEGKATELGIAVHKGLPIFVLGGKRNNVFLHLPWLHHVSSVEEFIRIMGEGGDVLRATA